MMNPDCPVALGDVYIFLPTSFTAYGEVASRMMGAETRLRGTVVEINREHRWYRVEAEYAGGLLYECFKF